MSKYAVCFRLVKHCVDIYGRNVRETLCDGLRKSVFVEQRNGFFNFGDCPPKDQPSCCCTEELDEEAKNAAPEYCRKKKESEANLKMKLKTLKEEYKEKLIQLKKDLKNNIKQAKEDYEDAVEQAHKDAKNEQKEFLFEYCELISKKKKVCYKIPPPVKVADCNENNKTKDGNEKNKSADCNENNKDKDKKDGKGC